MVYSLRVTLSGIKGFFRVYHINGESSLYSLHRQLVADLEFPTDIPILFKGMNDGGEVLGRYTLLFDLGYGTADSISLNDAVETGITNFTYFYDVPNKKSVNITIEGEVPGERVTAGPVLVDTKGPNPIEFENGYVAYEDLPEDQKHHLPGSIAKGFDKAGDDDDDLDDEDFDEDDEDDEDVDDDEDGKEIFDESEGI